MNPEKSNLTNAIDSGAYNGKNKLIVDSRNFMTKLDVKECMSLLNPKRAKAMTGFQCVHFMMPVCPLLNPCLHYLVIFTQAKKSQNNGKLKIQFLKYGKT